MYHYFHVKTIDNPDIYIVRVTKIWSKALIEQVAKATIMNQMSLEKEDFEIKEVKIPDSLLSQFIFVEGIAHFILN